jgi:hypothetical protein
MEVFMRSNVVKLRDHSTSPDQGSVSAFVRELSELGRKYGVGIGGTPTLFMLERDDYLFDYSLDANDALVLGFTESSR